MKTACPSHLHTTLIERQELSLLCCNNLGELGSHGCIRMANHQLSILEELKLIEQFYPEISLETLLEVATINGAKALSLNKTFGSFEKGKAPGVVLISNSDWKNMKLTSESTETRIV